MKELRLMGWIWKLNQGRMLMAGTRKVDLGDVMQAALRIWAENGMN